MKTLRTRCRRWRLVLAATSVALVAAALPATAAATPAYQGGASAGWGYEEGDVLTANPGTWTSTSDMTYAYAWFNESSVALGTGPTYTVTGKDVGHQIYAAITASDGSPPALIVNTPTVGPMRYRPPVNVEQPTVSGTALGGSTLVAAAGKWVSGGASKAPIEITYAWYRGCSTGPKLDCSNAGFVGGSSSLVLSSADVGRRVSLTVTASYPDGAGGEVSSSFWVGNLGPVVGSSIKPGGTLSGTIPWTVTAPGAQTVSFLVNGIQAATQVADATGAAVFALDTTALANGGNRLGVAVAWGDGTLSTVEIGSVTVSNSSPTPVVVRPLIGRPATTPRRPVAGKRFVVTFAVTRSDNHLPLTYGALRSVTRLNGKVVGHTRSFADGRARLVVKVPRTSGHKLLEVRLTIRLGDRSTTRVATFRVAGPG